MNLRSLLHHVILCAGALGLSLLVACAEDGSSGSGGGLLTNADAADSGVDLRTGSDSGGGTTSPDQDAGGVDAAADAMSCGECPDNASCANGQCVCDAGFVDVDGACVPEDPCAQVVCGDREVCDEGACVCEHGYERIDGACIPEDPCNRVMCTAGEVCEAGACVCDLGFERVDGVCRASELAARTADEVCARWTRDYPEQATTVWESGQGQCDPGTIDMTAHEDAMRRLNLYRWLVGLEPATVSWENQALAQEAALIMDVNNRLSHDVPAGWTCYSEGGALAASRSNLALGYRTPASTVDGYMRDSNTPSLGHRRWCIFPRLADTAFGHVGRGGAMWSLSRNNAPVPDFVAYPAPGAFPIDAILGVWSFSTSRTLSQNTTAQVTEVSSGRSVGVSVARLQENFGLSTISITLQDDVSPGETYTVLVEDGERAWEYRTSLVNCD